MLPGTRNARRPSAARGERRLPVRPPAMCSAAESEKRKAESGKRKAEGRKQNIHQHPPVLTGRRAFFIGSRVFSVGAVVFRCGVRAAGFSPRKPFMLIGSYGNYSAVVKLYRPHGGDASTFK